MGHPEDRALQQAGLLQVKVFDTVYAVGDDGKSTGHVLPRTDAFVYMLMQLGDVWSMMKIAK